MSISSWNTRTAARFGCRLTAGSFAAAAVQRLLLLPRSSLTGRFPKERSSTSNARHSRRDRRLLRLSSCSIVLGDFQSGGHRSQQLSFFQRLAQESHRASIEREHFGSLFSECCQENHWGAASVGQQLLLQVKPAHTRHLQVGDEKRSIGNFAGFQKMSG